MNKKALVTVYIPTYNRLELLKRSINSVLTQSYPNIELIVVDDGSTDGTIEFLQKISLLNPSIKYFQNEKNSGACVGRNKAIFSAQGEFITGLDDDDFFLPERITDFINAWGCKGNNTIALYSLTYIKTKNYKLNKTRRPRYINKNDILLTNYIGNQIFTRTEFLKDIDGFDINLPAWQDLDCWFRLLEKGKAKRVNAFTYVMDTSHPHERISTKRIENIRDACCYLVKKYKLNKKDEFRLKGQVRPYGLEFSYIDELYNCFLFSDFRSMWLLFKLVIRRFHRAFFEV